MKILYTFVYHGDLNIDLLVKQNLHVSLKSEYILTFRLRTCLLVEIVIGLTYVVVKSNLNQ